MAHKVRIEKDWTDAEVLTDPFIFRWSVNKPGQDGDEECWYEWREGMDGRIRLFPRCAPGVRTLIYTPSLSLFREFASLDGTPEAIRDFAGRRGDIRSGLRDISHTLQCSCGKHIVRGTSLPYWQLAVAKMRAMVELSDIIDNRTRHNELERYVTRHADRITYRIPLMGPVPEGFGPENMELSGVLGCIDIFTSVAAPGLVQWWDGKFTV